MKVVLLVVVLAVSLGGCLCKMEARELFPELLLDGTAQAKLRRRNDSFEYLKRLRFGSRDTVEEIFSNLIRIDSNQPISTYKAHHYQRLARLSSVRCRKSAYDNAQRMCKSTTMKSLKKYCEFCLTKIDEYCRENPKEMAKTILELDRQKPLVKGVDYYLNEAQAHMEAFEELARKSPQTTVKEWCHAGKPWTRFGQLSVCKRLLSVVDEEFAHLELDTDAVRELVEEIEGHPIDRPIQFCRQLRNECKVMMDFELDLGRIGLGKIDGNVGLV